MAGTFASFNTGLSALRYQRIAMDVAANNIANVTTDGFVRRRADAVSVGAATQAALWSRSDDTAGGVALGSLDRMVDPFLDARARREHGKQAYLDTRVAVLDRVESGIGEPGDSGVAAAIDDFAAAWADLGNHPEREAARTAVLAAGATLADAVHAQAASITTEISDQVHHAVDLAAEIDTAAADLAQVNRSLAAAQLDGTDTNDLLDRRDQLADRLVTLTGGDVNVRDDGGMDVSVGGASLVSGATSGSVSVTGGSAGAPLALTVADASTGAATPVAGSRWGGELGAVAELVTTTLPAHLAGLNQVARSLAEAVNTAHGAGYDLDGNQGAEFFAYTPGDEAASLAVAVTSPAGLAVSGIPGGNLDGSNATALAGATDAAASSYQRLVNGFGSTVQSATRLASTQRLVTAQVDGSREQLTGVNLDEETLNLVAAQRAYEAAARVISTVDAVLETLINRTGVTR
ncbi:flagellar hook-associated protein FlgK [Nocardioides deserti]|uniref:Flagellar hook-associated protein 1 n=1 Tax=Nocardioides deserti TaxID=1588644 RepID=A0ABR6UE49_9ACTN|nr:flagellar hook-associated protein FlgK [Nocardioides deserti]MBC2962438.1 flagellar hook-associated protein FlgK [Nocardioides deserti]GGO78019.1 flagellar hook-associated protein 1 [Nocardioides deserti]